jgi:hypothetical protein
VEALSAPFEQPGHYATGDGALSRDQSVDGSNPTYARGTVEFPAVPRPYRRKIGAFTVAVSSGKLPLDRRADRRRATSSTADIAADTLRIDAVRINRGIMNCRRIR